MHLRVGAHAVIAIALFALTLGIGRLPSGIANEQQALYRAVEVGKAIPAKLYAAVAEILAFIYRAEQLAAEAPRRSARAGV